MLPAIDIVAVRASCRELVPLAACYAANREHPSRHARASEQLARIIEHLTWHVPTDKTP